MEWTAAAAGMEDIPRIPSAHNRASLDVDGLHKKLLQQLTPSSTVRTSQMLLFLCAIALAMLSQGNFVRHDCGWPVNPKDERQNPLIGRFAGPNPLRGKEGGSAANGHFSGNAVNLAGCCLPTFPLINVVRMDSNCLGL